MSPELSARAARLSDAIAAEIEDLGVREMGAAIGRGKSIVWSYGSDLSRWSIMDALAMSEALPSIQAAAQDAFSAVAPRAGDGRRSLEDVSKVLPALLAEAQVMAAAIADHALSRKEARDIIGKLPDLIRDLAVIHADLIDSLKRPS